MYFWKQLRLSSSLKHHVFHLALKILGLTQDIIKLVILDQNIDVAYFISIWLVTIKKYRIKLGQKGI